MTENPLANLDLKEAKICAPRFRPNTGGRHAGTPLPKVQQAQKAMTGRTGRTELRCLKCDKLDPMKTDAVKWASSSLIGPHKTA
jgi:hypothetical protein